MTPEEIVDVVNEHNEVIGQKKRKDLTDDDCWRASCIWIENDKGEVLLQQRKFDRKVDPGKWTCAVVGTVPHGSTYEETAKREVVEEVGLTDFTLKPCAKVYCKASFGWRWNMGFKITDNHPLEYFSPQAEEVEQLLWIPKEAFFQRVRDEDLSLGSTVSSYAEMFNLS